MSETCIVCGREVPEGRQVCPQCEEDARRHLAGHLLGVRPCESLKKLFNLIKPGDEIRIHHEIDNDLHFSVYKIRFMSEGRFAQLAFSDELISYMSDEALYDAIKTKCIDAIDRQIAEGDEYFGQRRKV